MPEDTFIPQNNPLFRPSLPSPPPSPKKDERTREAAKVERAIEPISGKPPGEPEVHDVAKGQLVGKSHVEESSLQPEKEVQMVGSVLREEVEREAQQFVDQKFLLPSLILGQEAQFASVKSAFDELHTRQEDLRRLMEMSPETPEDVKKLHEALDEVKQAQNRVDNEYKDYRTEIEHNITRIPLFQGATLANVQELGLTLPMVQGADGTMREANPLDFTNMEEFIRSLAVANDFREIPADDPLLQKIPGLEEFRKQYEAIARPRRELLESIWAGRPVRDEQLLADIFPYFQRKVQELGLRLPHVQEQDLKVGGLLDFDEYIRCLALENGCKEIPHDHPLLRLSPALNGFVQR